MRVIGSDPAQFELEYRDSSDTHECQSVRFNLDGGVKVMVRCSGSCFAGCLVILFGLPVFCDFSGKVWNSFKKIGVLCNEYPDQSRSDALWLF
jgi:hypothetical protein